MVQAAPKLGKDMDAGSGLMGSIRGGRILVVLDRFDHWQVGFVFPKGQYQQVKATGMEAMRHAIVELEPRFAEHVETLRDWHQLTLLSVESSRCPRWYQPGLLLIGDAAHVMSPVGGVGINYAIQDAEVHPGIPGDDAEATPGTGAGFDPDHPSGTRPCPLACANANPKGLAAAVDWVWGPTSSGGRLATLSQAGTTTQRGCGRERRRFTLAQNALVWPAFLLVAGAGDRAICLHYRPLSQCKRWAGRLLFRGARKRRKRAILRSIPKRYQAHY